MSKNNNDIICVGEALIDFIGDELATNLTQTKSFSKYVGGSPTNVAKNMAQLGFNSTLIATLGADSLGDFITQQLNVANLNLQYLAYKKELKTSLILVARSMGTPEFLPYRQADKYIEPDQIPIALLKDSKIFHTTCFALSKNPAQNTILQKAKEAFENDCQLSIDLNYAQKIWEEVDVLPVLKTFCQYHPMVKLSNDDAFRIFHQNLSNQQIFDYFHQLGAAIICLTKGKEGAYLSQKGQKVIFQVAPIVANVVDVTGAGDAFWSGFLAGYLKKQPLKDSLKMANNLVAKKIQHIGGLPKTLKIDDLLE